MRVHAELGPGLLEVSYQDALALEFQSQGVPFEREFPVMLWYRGQRIGGTYRADFRCHATVLVELKALPVVGHAEVRQLAHYLKATGYDTGLLLNFGANSLQFQRVRPCRSDLSGPPEQIIPTSARSEVPHTRPDERTSTPSSLG